MCKNLLRGWLLEIMTRYMRYWDDLSLTQLLVGRIGHPKNNILAEWDSYVAQKFLNGPASFWDLFSSYLAQSSHLVRNISEKYSTRETCRYGGLSLVFFTALYEPVPEDQIQSVLNLWNWDEHHNLDKQGFFSWGRQHQHGMDLHTGLDLGQGQTIDLDLVLTWKFDSLLESLYITKHMTSKSLVDE